MMFSKAICRLLATGISVDLQAADFYCHVLFPIGDIQHFDNGVDVSQV